MPICFRLFAHDDRFAASLANCTAGNKRPINTASMQMTTSNSIRLKARDLCIEMCLAFCPTCPANIGPLGIAFAVFLGRNLGAYRIYLRRREADPRVCDGV